MSEKTITIITEKAIKVTRGLVYVDKTVDIEKVGAIVSGEALIRVNTLLPVMYELKKGTNEVPEPYTFIDPITRKQVSESITTWPSVKALVNKGVIKIYGDVLDLEGMNKAEKTDKKNNVRPKSMSDMAQELNTK